MIRKDRVEGGRLSGKKCQVRAKVNAGHGHTGSSVTEQDVSPKPSPIAMWTPSKSENIGHAEVDDRISDRK
ncbi:MULTISPECIES: hypothetical protein [Sphingobium]|jgi:hypothetical protein|uniref:hypothetical protein n=1 Tax=Sphingobium TaxID=165695 RepID=UPI0012E3E725|nr:MULTISPECIES: hypothetical protein [Sphingobium]